MVWMIRASLHPKERKNVLYIENVYLDARNIFFSVRVIIIWNRIPNKVKEQRSINAFEYYD